MRIILLAVLMALFAQPAYADSLTDTEWQFLDLLNQHRAANGKPPVKVHPGLTEASEWHTADMAANNYFAHQDSLGREPWDRMCIEGDYCYSTWKGENIAAGFDTAQAVFDAWERSPPHNANMLQSVFVTTGLDQIDYPGSNYRYYWNQGFGGLDPDIDGDGWTDSQEYMTGKDWNNPCSIPPDINGNGRVNTLDAGTFVFYLNEVRTAKSALVDLDQNGRVNTIDVGFLVPVLNKTTC